MLLRYSNPPRRGIVWLLVILGTSVSIDEARSQVTLSPAPVAGTPDFRILCTQESTGTLSFTNGSNTACADAAPKTNITGITITGGTGLTLSGANLSVTGATGNLTASGGTHNITGFTDITGSGTVSGAAVSAGAGGLSSSGGANITGGINNNNGGITNAGAISGATNVTATGTVSGATLTDGMATMSGGNLSGVGTLTATTGNITTVNSISLVNAGTTTTNALAVGGGGITVAPGAPVNMGGNRVQNVGAPIVATDAANKAYVDASVQAQGAVINERINEAFKRIDENAEGIAVAVAMGGLSLPAGKNFAFGTNIGFYDDKQAVAAQAAIRLNRYLSLNAGVGVGFEENKVGGRVGFMSAW